MNLNRVKIFSACILAVVLSACGASVSTPTRTPQPTFTYTPTVIPTQTPTPTPAVALDVLDWHLRFSTDQSTTIMRCRSENVSLVTPLPVTLRATLITPQILHEAMIIFRQANPALADEIARAVDDPDYLYVLLSLHLINDQNLFRLVEMPLRTDNAELHSLSEIQFFFEDGSPSLELGDDKNLQTDQREENLSFEQLTAIPFLLNDLQFEDVLNTSEIKLSANLTMALPVRNTVCDSRLNTPFSLTLRTTSGDGRQVPALYGSVNEHIPSEAIDRIRLEILTNTLLQPFKLPATP